MSWPFCASVAAPTIFQFGTRKLESTLLTNFSDLSLAEPILRAVTTEGYTAPTPIQSQAIPAILNRNDVIGIAQTGTGKTAAFVLPILDWLVRNPERVVRKRCRVLILTPTRELASQIQTCIRAYGRHIRPKTAVVIGGAKHGPQIKALTAGADIVVATPGRLEDHMAAGVFALDRVQTVVLDEADQMLDLGFLPAIRRIVGKLSPERQTLLFSATMPKSIRTLAASIQKNAKEVSVAPAAKPVDKVEQKVIHVRADTKRDALVTLLKDPDVTRAIVFTRTKHRANQISQFLEKSGLVAEAIHGNKSQSQRERALKAFRTGKARILVATDVASRGIDIDDVSHVVNFELPDVPDVYVHRIGRTARAGAAGVAVTLCAPADRVLLHAIGKLINRNLLGDEFIPPAAKRSRRPFQKSPRPAQKKPHRGQRSGARGKSSGAPRGGARNAPRNAKASGADKSDEGMKAGLARMLGA